MTDVDEFIDNFLQHAITEERRAYNRAYYLRTRKLKNGSREERLAMQERKLQQARANLNKMPPGKKRNALQRRLDQAQKKLKQARDKAKQKATKAQQITVGGKKVNVLLNNTEVRTVGRDTRDIKLPKGAQRGDRIKVTDGLFVKERATIVRKNTRGRGGSV